MYQQKTKETDNSVTEFIERTVPPEKREDTCRLLEIFSEATGYPPKMWGPSIIGFGSYHYKYASGHEGDAPLAGFSPRKANFSLYLAAGDPERENLLQQLGKHTTGKGCVYVKKLADIDVETLKKMIASTVKYLKETYP